MHAAIIAISKTGSLQAHQPLGLSFRHPSLSTTAGFFPCSTTSPPEPRGLSLLYLRSLCIIEVWAENSWHTHRIESVQLTQELLNDGRHRKATKDGGVRACVRAWVCMYICGHVCACVCWGLNLRNHYHWAIFPYPVLSLEETERKEVSKPMKRAMAEDLSWDWGAVPRRKELDRCWWHPGSRKQQED